jgi:N-acetyltransferase
MMDQGFFARPTLQGHGLRLEPLATQHEAALRDAASDGQLWKLRVTSVPEPEHTAKYIADALRMLQERKRVPYVVVDEATGRVLGSSSFHDLIPETKRLEIGYTWYAQSVQRTHVNTACKLLMMTRAFDELGANLVGWRTDILNRASQRAIERLGAQREAVLRSQALRRDGTIRDTVVYGMPAHEWPIHRNRLLARLAAGQRATEGKAARQLVFAPLAELTRQQVQALGRLSPGALGWLLVAPNATSITDAWGHPNAVLWAMLEVPLGAAPTRASPVGLMLLFDPTLSPDDAKTAGKPLDDLYAWRLSVGFDHQGKGYGLAAMQHAIAYARTRPGIARMSLSHVNHPGHAGPFYEKLGFRYTGAIDPEDGELSMSLAL